jgi:hypothetical protein
MTMMTMMKWLLLLLLLCNCLLVNARTTTSTTTTTTTTTTTAQKVLEWIDNADEGYFNPKQTLQELENSTQSSVGIFANEDIEEGELLLQVPWELIIQSKDPTEEGQMCCGTVQAVLNEMKLAKESKYYPYSLYLQLQDDDELPSAWSDKGKQLLYEIIGQPHGNDPRTVDFDCIPPEEPIEWYVPIVCFTTYYTIYIYYIYSIILPSLSTTN